MDTKHTKAKFWKCALQVNPASYIKYRGEEQEKSESEYNQELLQVCKEEDISILGIADHGNVDAIDSIRQLMHDNNILVFPGFEIASSEKVHFVCLFDENTSTVQLNRYLGTLRLTDPDDGVRPSELSAEHIFQEVEKLGGFIYAAHCHEDSGLLNKRLSHIWQNPLLKAAQIKSSIEELKSVESDFYRKVILNKEEQYKRDIPLAIINAKDVESPNTLTKPSASCLIKMTTPSFEAFKLAFQDPESRIRLNSDIQNQFYSQIESLSVVGGYLDGLSIDFSGHLNTVIGGRGTGKSTLLETIRFALELTPIGKNAKTQHDAIIKENLGRSMASVSVVVRSSAMNGQKFTVRRKVSEGAVVLDNTGNVSSFLVSDILPTIEVYGQNEIYEIAQDKNTWRDLLDRFIDPKVTADHENEISEIENQLYFNRDNLVKALEALANTEDDLSKLPKLEEQLLQFQNLGIEDKLKTVPILESERSLLKRVSEEVIDKYRTIFAPILSQLPDLSLLTDASIQHLTHKTELSSIRAFFEAIEEEIRNNLTTWEATLSKRLSSITPLTKKISDEIIAEETLVERTFKELPAYQGKSGREIGIEYKNLLQNIEKIKPQTDIATTQQSDVDRLTADRKKLLFQLSEARTKRSASFQKSIKKLNKKLDNKLALTVVPESNRNNVIKYLLSCNLEGVAEKRLSWINETDFFSPIQFVQKIREGSDALIKSGWGLTPTAANAFTRLTARQLLELEEIEMEDTTSIRLNVSHSGDVKLKELEHLSTGQQCTAILHLLLLENRDPLIMDQPEDNLDNAFIADRIVTELRSAKLERQFLFATHNANIPVFGDAEWIGVFDVLDNQANMPPESQGGVDVCRIREKAAEILEGGKTAFNQRKNKYGY